MEIRQINSAPTTKSDTDTVRTETRYGVLTPRGERIKNKVGNTLKPVAGVAVAFGLAAAAFKGVQIHDNNLEAMMQAEQDKRTPVSLDVDLSEKEKLITAKPGDTLGLLIENNTEVISPRGTSAYIAPYVAFDSVVDKVLEEHPDYRVIVIGKEYTIPSQAVVSVDSEENQ
jgi:hypothetical protein